jgi:uncharacterized protein YerC
LPPARRRLVLELLTLRTPIKAIKQQSGVSDTCIRRIARKAALVVVARRYTPRRCP